MLLTFDKQKAEYTLSVSNVEREFEFVREQDGLDESEILHPYYQLPDGSFVSKNALCKAIELLKRFMQGHSPMYMTDEELFANGNEPEAVIRYYEKYGCTALEAKRAIETLRGIQQL